MERLGTLLKEIDGLGYKADKHLAGSYQFDGYRLTIDHVQGDPFAQPSRISIHIASADAALPAELWSSKIRKTASEDFIARAVARAILANVKGHRGIGHSGEVRIATSGQQVLVRNSVKLFSCGKRFFTARQQGNLLRKPADCINIPVPDHSLRHARNPAAVPSLHLRQ